MREANVRICEYEMNVRCEENGAILYYCIRADGVGTSGIVCVCVCIALDGRMGVVGLIGMRDAGAGTVSAIKYRAKQTH